jgi:hypothetical protein
LRFIRFLAAFLIAGQLWSAGAQASADPLELYGDEVRFDIVRKGRTVGSRRSATATIPMRAGKTVN